MFKSDNLLSNGGGGLLSDLGLVVDLDLLLASDDEFGLGLLDNLLNLLDLLEGFVGLDLIGPTI